MNMTITGERIRLRPYRDYDEYHAWRCDEAREGSPWWGPLHEPGARDRQAFEGSGLFMDEYGCFAVEHLESGRHIGNEYFSSKDGYLRSAMVGTRIHPDWRGQGYGVEARQLAIGWLFGNYAIRRVCAETMDDNHAARRSLELCGMRCMGIKPCQEFSRGQWHGMAWYGISRDEWKGATICQ